MSNGYPPLPPGNRQNGEPDPAGDNNALVAWAQYAETVTGPAGPEGPQGPVGPAGQQGVQGPPGAEGQSGTSTVVVGSFGVSKTPDQLPSTGFIPANFDAPGAPAADYQMTVGQSLFYTGADSGPYTHGDLFVFVTTATHPNGWVDGGNLRGPEGQQGPPGVQGPTGADGSTGPKGDTGNTGAPGTDGSPGAQGPAGPGLLPGGTVGQLPVKASGADYDTEWADTRQVFVQAGAPAAGAGQRVGDLWAAAAVSAAMGVMPAGIAETFAVTRTVLPGENIQAAIDLGPGVVVLGAGTHNVTAPIRMGNQVILRGEGRATRVVLTQAGESVIECKGDIIAFQIENMRIDAQNAQYGVNCAVNFTGTSVDGEPDCMGRIDLLWVYDAQDIGLRFGDVAGDVQNMIVTRCRVRRAGNYGMWIGDASTVTAPDNMFAFIDVTTSNQTGAGVYVGAANCHFVAVKAWYCRNYGFHVKATRCTFTACETQDTRNHGWYLEWGKNLLTGCVADSAAYGDVGGVANGADGFYVVDGSNVLNGCNSFDRQQGYPSQQRYGYNCPASMKTAHDATALQTGCNFVGNTGFQNLTGLYNWR